MFIQKPFSLTTSTGDAAVYVPEGAMWFDSGDGTELNAASRTSDASNKKRNIISVWRKGSYPQTGSGSQVIGVASPDYDRIEFAGTVGGTQLQYSFDAGGTNYVVTSTVILRDPTGWQHIVISFDSTQVSGRRVSFYYNGVLIPAQTYSGGGEVPADFESELLGNSITTDISDGGANNSYFSEFIAIDGKSIQNGDVALSAFGTENSDGLWVPVDPTTVFASGSDFGNNGFYLDFADSSDFGNDVSGNNNDFTSSNTTTANWTYDRPADDSGTATGNLCTWNALVTGTDGSTSWNVYPLLSEGNTKYTGAGTEKQQYVIGTIAVETGKYAWRVKYVTGVANGYPAIGLAAINYPIGYDQGLFGADAYAWAMFTNDGGGESGKVNHEGTLGSSLFTLAEGDYVDIALDLDNNKLWFGQNGTWSGDPAAGTGEAFNSGLTGIGPIAPVVSGGSYSTTSVAELDITGVTLPTGFKYLNTANLPAPTITKPSDNFLPVLYEGNGAGQRVGNFIPFTDAYTVEDSARFDVADTDYLSKTDFGGSGTGAGKTWTYSVWVKRGALSTGYGQTLFGVSNPGVDSGMLKFDGPSGTVDNGLLFWIDDPTNGTWYFRTKRQFESTDSWTHIVVAVDTDQAVSTNIVKIYFNGVLEFNYYEYDTVTRYTDTLFGQDYDHAIGYDTFNSNTPCDGYMAEAIFVDGYQLDASVFGQTDTSTNRWIPKEVTVATLNTAGGGSSGFGTNGFYLDMAMENSLGNDVSGNNNDFAMNNMDNTNGSNQMYDTPTRNFITWDPASKDSSATLTLGNLKAVGTSGSTADRVDSTMFLPSSGKYYFEGRVDAIPAGQPYPVIGLGVWNSSYNNFPSQTGNGGIDFRADSKVFAYNYVEVADYSSAVTWSAGDVIGVAVDMDTGKVWFSYNGTFQGSGDPGAGTNQTYTITPNLTTLMPQFTGYSNGALTANYGQWRYFDGAATTLDTAAGGYFQSTSVPTGFKAIQQDNLAENTAGITGFSWIKNRDADDYHVLQNRVRGIYYYVTSDHDTETAESKVNNSVQRFLQQGVQIGEMEQINTVSESHVLWQWAANGTGTLNEEGSEDSTVSANTDAGFSVATFEGTGVNATVGHGLSAAPEFVMIKNASQTNNWAAGHTSLTSWSYYLVLDQNVAEADTPTIFDGGNYAGGPTADVVYLGSSHQSNGPSETMIMWSWVGVDGYSKFGSYAGNDADDGPFVYLGFKPAWLMIKRRGSTGNWTIRDDKRNPYNPVNLELYANADDAEYTEDPSLDFTSNGFKLRDRAGALNADDTYIYCAFAENPFGGSGVGQARAR